jgi:hypothetical protein
MAAAANALLLGSRHGGSATGLSPNREEAFGRRGTLYSLQGGIKGGGGIRGSGLPPGHLRSLQFIVRHQLGHPAFK